MHLYISFFYAYFAEYDGQGRFCKFFIQLFLSLSLVQAGSLAEEELVKNTVKGGRLSLKGVLHVHLSLHPLLAINNLSLCKNCWKTIENLLFSLLWGGCKLKVCRTICVQHLCHEMLEIPHLVIHQHASRLVFLCHTLTEDSL